MSETSDVRPSFSPEDIIAQRAKTVGTLYTARFFNHNPAGQESANDGSGGKAREGGEGGEERRSGQARSK
jgi:hypothetical protein